MIAGVRLSVLFSYQGNDMSTSFQVIAAGRRQRATTRSRQSGKDGFWLSMWRVRILAVINVAQHHDGPAL